ncbi:MAG TPA: hypothetical protein VGP68_07965 [Gemmataceae bacterium]|jgi:hypothetical protein|nr:hypothetical protein [Gemmataceae bacterium]
MTWRSLRVLFLPCVILLLGASYPSTNFVVEAPTPQIAEQVSKWAEYYRREKAVLWLGKEMPNWPTPCPLHVKVTHSGASGATSFNFSGGGVWQTMEIEGPLDRLIYSVLPHEVTHTVFAHYFGAPVPRWADEGGAVLSEDEIECSRHDTMVRQILNAGGALRLPSLFSLKDYPRDPRDIGALYAQGFSVSKFLVGLSNRQTFLSFVAHGMQSNYGWDNAARTYYRFQNVTELEQAWLADLRNSRKQPASAAPVILAKNEVGSRTDSAKAIVRLTAPPAQPLADDMQPTFRTQAPDNDGGWSNSPRGGAARGSRPGYLPETEAVRPPLAIGRDNWQAPAVHLGAPEFSAPTSSAPNRTAVPQQGNASVGSPGYPY